MGRFYKEHALAQELLEKALVDQPDRMWNWLYMGATLFYLERYDEAEDHYVHATKQWSDDEVPWAMLACFYYDCDRMGESKIANDKALAIDPTSERCLYRQEMFELLEADGKL